MDIRTLGIRPGSIIEAHSSTGELARAKILAIDCPGPLPLKIEWLRHGWSKNVEGKIEYHHEKDWSESWKLCEAESVSGILERYENPDVP